MAGLPVHIIQRGNNRQVCFFADEDYQFFLDHLAQLARRFLSNFVNPPELKKTIEV